MNSSFSKKRHIQESNRLLETRLLGRTVLFEYDIDDDNKSSVEQELSSVSSDIQTLNPELDFTTTDSAQNSLDNSDVCLIGDDINGYVNKKFGQKIKELFPDKFQEVVKTMSDYINKFIERNFFKLLLKLKTACVFKKPFFFTILKPENPLVASGNNTEFILRFFFKKSKNFFPDKIFINFNDLLSNFE